MRLITRKALSGMIVLLALGIPAYAQTDVLSISVSPSSLVGGSTQTATATITLTGPSTANIGVTVSYSPNTVILNGITNGGLVVIPAGQTTATLTFSAGGGSASNITATIKAIVSSTVSTTFTITPQTFSFSFSPSSLVGESATTVTGTVTLAQATLQADSVFLSGQSNFCFQGYPSSVVIPAGGTIGTFTFQDCDVVSQPTAATLTAFNGTTQTATLTINPFSLSVDLNPFTITGTSTPPTTSTATVTLSPPPKDIATVSIGSSNQNNVATPNAVFIQANASSVQFPLTGNAGFGPQTIIITATFGVRASGLLCIVSCSNETGTPTQCEKGCGSPINLTNGNVWITERDYSVPGLGGGIELTRTWNSL